MSEKSHFRGSIAKQHGKPTQTLLKYALQHLYHIYWSLAKQLSWKKYLLLTCKILELFSSILAAKDKSPVLNRVNLTIPVKVQLSQKEKKFSEVFSSFMKSSLNFEHFEENDEPHRFCISEITDSEVIVRWMSKRSGFGGSIKKQHGKLTQTLLKYGAEPLYNIY